MPVALNRDTVQQAYDVALSDGAVDVRDHQEVGGGPEEDAAAGEAGLGPTLLQVVVLVLDVVRTLLENARLVQVPQQAPPGFRAKREPERTDRWVALVDTRRDSILPRFFTYPLFSPVPVHEPRLVRPLGQSHNELRAVLVVDVDVHRVRV